MNKEEHSIVSGAGNLAGELCLPSAAGTFPTVLMIHGSGPLDRNENMPRQKLNIFNELADCLAAQGIASFRYDKRGCGDSDGDYLLAGHSDLVEDASACINHLASIPTVDAGQLFLLGHSEGTIIAAQLSERHPQLAGLVLLCPFVEPMESVLRRQARQMQDDLQKLTGLRGLITRLIFSIVGKPVATQEKLLAKLASTDDSVIRSMTQKVNAKWLRELIALDNEAIYSRVRSPMLLVAGEKDVQCLPSDVGKIANLVPVGVTSHVVPDLTHILRMDTEQPSIFGYGRLLQQPIDGSVCRLVSDWIGQQVGR